MAYAAVTSLKQTVDQFLNRGLQLDFDLEEKFKSLSEKLSVIQGLLEDSVDRCSEMESLERRIKHLAYKIEDFVEEFMCIGIEASDVFDMFDEEYNFSSNMSKILDEINSIKAKLTKISKGTNPTIKVQQVGESSVEHPSVWSWNPEDTMVGLDDDLLKIKERLTGMPCKLDVLTIVGMGGIGKTTLARSIFNDTFIEYHFYIRAWITVTQKYRVRNILIGLLRSITNLADDIYKRSDEQLAELLYKRLKGQRYLVVLDDIWSKKCWYDLKRCFPDDKNGSRIILTSREVDVAVYANRDSHPHHISFLSLDKSWELLSKKVFLKETCPPELEDIGKKIAEKCQGLPLGILLIAGYLSNINRTPSCWMDVANEVPLLVSRKEECLDILALSYTSLPYHLKACFLYMGAFPEDFEIPAWRLIRLWVAEGLLRAEWPKSSEEVAELCLEDLVGRSLIMVTKRKSNAGIKSCGLHDLVRDLILREAQKEKFLHVLKLHDDVFPKNAYNKRRLCFHSTINGRQQSHYTNHFINSMLGGESQIDDVLDLDCHANVKNQFNVKCSVLLNRSILCFGWPQISKFNDMLTSQIICKDFKLLRILDIPDRCFEHLPVEITQLVHLRYLALATRSYFPAKLSKLWNLQTLVNGHYCGRVILPDDICEMTQMRHLHVKHGGHLPSPAGAKVSGNSLFILPNLQTVSSISFASSSREFFASVPKLKKLGIFETAKESLQAQDCLNHLFYLTELEKFKCAFLGRGFLPHWKAFPPKLRKLTLSGCSLPWQDMETLGKLPNLEILKLKDYAFKGPYWEPAEEGFELLKYLLIERTDIVNWEATSIHFPNLQHLILRCCENLKKIPQVIGEIPTLQIIDLDDSSPSAVTSARDIQQEQQSMGNDELLVRIKPR